MRLNSASGEPLSATLFVKVWTEQMEHSQEWWSKCVKPPVFRDKRDVNAKLYSTGTSADSVQKDFVSAFKKVLLVRERVLQLLDKTSSNQDRHPTAAWANSDSLGLVGVTNTESLMSEAQMGSSEVQQAHADAVARAERNTGPARSLRRVFSLRGSSNAQSSGPLLKDLEALEETMSRITGTYAAVLNETAIQQVIEGAVPINTATERLRNSLNFNVRRIEEVERLMARVKRMCYQLSVQQSSASPVAGLTPKPRRRLSSFLT